MTDTPIPAASVAVLNDDRFLLVRRGREPAKGLYAFPGGRLEDGEHAEQAARRELFEETGITAGPLRFVRDLDVGAAGTRKDGGGFRLSVFCGRYEHGVPRAGDDADHAGWYGIEEMRDLPMTETTLQIALELAGKS